MLLLKKWIRNLVERIHNFMLNGEDPKWIYALSVTNDEGSVIDKIVEANIAQRD